MFAPAIAMDFSTHQANQPPAIVSTITQPNGDNPLASARLEFPPQFGFNETFHPKRCQPADESATTCPAASKIGTIAATSSFGPASGNVYITDDLRIVAFASAAGGTVNIKAVGTISLTPTGGFAVDFTGLPNLPVQSTKLTLAGGDESLLRLPRACGSYTIPAHFVSHDGETADLKPTLDVTGCPVPKERTSNAVVLTVDKGFGLATLQAGVDAYGVGTAKQDSLDFILPVSRTTLHRHSATLRTKAGISQRHRSAGTDLTLKNIDVAVNRKRVTLSGFSVIKGLGYDRFDFASGKAGSVKLTKSGVRVRKVALKLNGVAAAALDTELSTQQFHAGQVFAIARISAKR